MATRAKFRCASIEDFGMNRRIKLIVVYGLPHEGPPTEDDRFTQATPSGEIWMTIDNPKASCQFIPNEYYYVDFTRAPSKGEEA